MNEMSFFIVFIIIGCAFIGLGEFFYLDMTGLGKKKAIKEFPIAIKRLGFSLSHQGSAQTFGFIQGRIGRYGFYISPDYGAKVALRMPSIAGLVGMSTVKGTITFDSENKGFDRTFRTREVSGEIKATTQFASRFLESATSFAKKWNCATDFIGIDEGEIVVTLRYGHGTYIPASVLEEIVGDMVVLADEIQRSFG